jgi:cell division protein FtsB
MPPARSTAAPRSSARARPRPAGAGLVEAAMRIRWDRVGRVALLLLLLFVVGLYIAPARALFSTWRDSHAKQAQLHALEREHAALAHQARALRSPLTVAAEARRLGMVKPGERPYVVRGLPRD